MVVFVKDLTVKHGENVVAGKKISTTVAVSALYMTVDAGSLLICRN